MTQRSSPRRSVLAVDVTFTAQFAGENPIRDGEPGSSVTSATAVVNATGACMVDHPQNAPWTNLEFRTTWRQVTNPIMDLIAVPLVWRTARHEVRRSPG